MQPDTGFEQGKQVTVLITAEAGQQYELHPGLPFLGVSLPEAPAFSLDLPLGNPGVKVIPGDARETLAQMARDAIEYRDCSTDEECAGLRERYAAVLGALGGGQ